MQAVASDGLPGHGEGGGWWIDHQVGGRGGHSGWGRPQRMDEDTVHFARRLATTLMVVARITTPKRYDSTAWRRAALRISLELMSVSETWKVMPRVSAI